jgi:hypothetical protein
MPRARGLLPLLLVLLPLPALCAAATVRDEAPFQPFWAGVGMGGGRVESLAPAPSAGRGGLNGSIEVGYRLTPNWGLGMELGALVPVSGCREVDCGEPADFAPAFNRLFAFGEFRPRHSGLRLRAGVGMSRFCYARHWDEDGWSMFDTLMVVFDSDYLYTDGSGAWQCDAARRAFGGALSVGYDWQAGRDAPVSVGVRLTAEAAHFSAGPPTGQPAFRHRAVMLSLHLLVH